MSILIVGAGIDGLAVAPAGHCEVRELMPGKERLGNQQFQAAFPQIAENARAFRAFLGRGVTYLAAQAGIRQFVDVGTGLPTENNTHELAQRVAPECRIVYVDNDPLVLAHARALLVGAPEGATDYFHADLHEPETIMKAARQVLDSKNPSGPVVIVGASAWTDLIAGLRQPAGKL